MTTQAVARQKRLRYRKRSSEVKVVSLITSIFFLGLGIPLIAQSITSPENGQSPGGPFVGAVGAFLTLAGLACAAPPFWPTLVLTAHTLRRPRAFRRTRIIPLEEVTGIGLVYQRAAGSATPQGWFLYLWTTGDIPRDLGIAYAPTSWLFPISKVRQKFLAVEPSAAELRERLDRYKFSFRFDPVIQTDPDKIAATYAARVAREIYDRVLAYQGPSGLLATRQDQKHVPVHAAYFRSSTAISPVKTAYWSPDGEIGRATLKPQPYRPELPHKRPPRPKRPGPLRGLEHFLQLIGAKFGRRRGDVRRDIFG
jgi:hypothetical protein